MNQDKYNLSDKIILAIREVLGEGSIDLHAPHLKGNEKKYLNECIDSTYVSSVGQFVSQFEKELSEYVDSKNVIAVSSGTAALQIALRVAGVRRDDEVIMPSLTFAATANSASYLGAIPHFVDIEKNRLGLDPCALKEWLEFISESKNNECWNKSTGRRIKAVVPMHTFGHPSKIDEILKVAYNHHLTVIEDSAESLGSYYKGKHTGTFGKLGIISFNGNKIITTGGGGAILTDDPQLAELSRHLSTTAKLPHPWKYVHNDVGYNYRMPNINAAIGCAQLERIDYIIRTKRELYKKYKSAFKSVKGVQLLSEPSDSVSNYWLQTIILDEEHTAYRDDILKRTNDSLIKTRAAWDLLSSLDPYKSSPKAPLRVSEEVVGRLINLPSSPGLFD